jgi:hypothetical protein
LDVTSWEIGLILDYPAALFLEIRFGFLNALYSNLQNRPKRRAALNKQIDIFSVEAD